MPSKLGKDLTDSFNKFTSGPFDQEMSDEEKKKKKEEDMRKASNYLGQDPNKPTAKASQYLGN